MTVASAPARDRVVVHRLGRALHESWRGISVGITSIRRALYRAILPFEGLHYQSQACVEAMRVQHLNGPYSELSNAR